MECLAYTFRTRLLPRVRFAVLARSNPEAAARLLNQTSFDDHTFIEQRLGELYREHPLCDPPDLRRVLAVMPRPGDIGQIIGFE
jgi:hypothetical protein